jgi:hypothetical protein
MMKKGRRNIKVRNEKKEDVEAMEMERKKKRLKIVERNRWRNRRER